MSSIELPMASVAVSDALALFREPRSASGGRPDGRPDDHSDGRPDGRPDGRWVLPKFGETLKIISTKVGGVGEVGKTFTVEGFGGLCPLCGAGEQVPAVWDGSTLVVVDDCERVV